MPGGWVFWLALAAACCTAAGIRDPDLLGWNEGGKAPGAREQQQRGGGGAGGARAPHDRVRGQEVLSWDPRIFLYRGLLTDGAFRLCASSLLAARCPFPRRPHPTPALAPPRVRLLRAAEECDHLVGKATPRLRRSGVVADKGGDDISDIRTSYGMFFEREEDVVVAAVERKLSEWTLIPVGHGEGIQVLRYFNGQEYKPHFD
jgi:hypothetical protein